MDKENEIINGEKLIIPKRTALVLYKILDKISSNNDFNALAYLTGSIKFAEANGCFYITDYLYKLLNKEEEE
jgi:hypothetical protein